MARKRSIEWLIKNYLPFLETFGMDEKNIRENYVNNWVNKDKNDVESYLWSIFNLLIDENLKQSKAKNLEGYYDRNMKIYSKMSIFLRKYKSKPAGHLQKLYNENYIKKENQSFKDNTFHMDVAIYCKAIDCKFGDEVDGKLISIKEALENSIIPYDKCTSEVGCLCFYSIRPRRDENDDLIYKDDYLIKKKIENKKGFWSRLFS
ncbi:hypothetical protein ACFFU9_14905 [Mariniflexile ostreae]|uniref:Uncharacterized protein n=1 Tax=Mariniflexile ostreae TaxID=1520892 RepID=A0ABV5FEZ3_9FLAO